MQYTEVSLNARKQILQSIGWVMFIFCLGRTYIQEDANKTSIFDFVWVHYFIFFVD